jgi:hypothetical protein
VTAHPNWRLFLAEEGLQRHSLAVKTRERHGVVATLSARERFTPRELSAAYQDYTEQAPQYLNAETGHRATAYRFGARMLIVCEEPEVGLVVLATLEEQAAAERESGK